MSDQFLTRLGVANGTKLEAVATDAERTVAENAVVQNAEMQPSPPEPSLHSGNL